MAEEKKTDNDFFKKYSLAILSIGILAVFLVFVLYLNSRTKEGGIVFPAGVNYLSPDGSTEQKAPEPPKPTIDFAAWSSGNWVETFSINYPFAYERPEGLNPLFFPNDPTEKIAFDGNGVPPEFNIMLLIEDVASYDKTLVDDPKKFVEETYWKQFGGIEGVDSIEEIENKQKLTGYVVKYAKADGTVTSEHVFLELPKQPGKLVHVMNVFPADYKEKVFDRIVDSIRYETEKPTPTTTPPAEEEETTVEPTAATEE